MDKFRLNTGQIINLGDSFSYAGKQYAKKYLLTISSEDRLNFGHPIIMGPKGSSEYYTVSPGGLQYDSDKNVYVQQYVSTPKDLSVLKQNKINGIKEQANSLLQPSDWKVVRSAETGKPVDYTTLAYREAIREQAEAHETAINAVSTISELEALSISDWPTVEGAQTLDNAKDQRVKSAWNHMWTLLEDSHATVPIGDPPTLYNFTADAEARENILGINTAIALGLPVPNPRPYTPKGSLLPINVTHTEFGYIGLGLLAVKDSYIQQYLTHKATINALTTINAVENYDFTTGYP